MPKPSAVKRPENKSGNKTENQAIKPNTLEEIMSKQDAANKLAMELEELADAVRKIPTGDAAALRLVKNNIEHRNHSLSIGREWLDIILSEE
jgi:hypothetical protein